MDNAFYKSKVYIATRFLQAVYSSELVSKIVQLKLVLVNKCIFGLPLKELQGTRDTLYIRI